MAWSTGFPVNVVKITLVRLQDLCKTESKNTSETSDVSRSPPFQNTLTSTDTTRLGTNLSLLIVTLIGANSGSKRRFIQDFTRMANNINGDSEKEIPEARIPTIKNRIAGNRSVRQRNRQGNETARIEMHQSQLLKTN